MAFSEYFNAKELGNYAESVLASKPPLLWNTLFPAQSIPTLSLSWIKSRNNNPRVLRPSSFGEKAARRSLAGVKKIESELPFFREAMVIGEKERQEITSALTLHAQNPDIVEQILENLYREHAELIWGAHANCDLMCGSLLTSGEINFCSSLNDGRINNYSYDYDADGTWRTNNILNLGVGQYWNDACAETNDPLDDILSAIEDQKSNGWQTSRILMNTATFRSLCKSQSIAKAISPLGGVIRRSQVTDLIQDEARSELVVYDKLVTQADGQSVNVIPDGKVCLLPDGELGRMCFAPTPEAYNQQLGKTEPRKDIAVMQNGVTILTRAEDNPVDYETIVSMVALPSFPMMDAVYVLNVLPS